MRSGRMGRGAAETALAAIAAGGLTTAATVMAAMPVSTLPRLMDSCILDSRVVAVVGGVEGQSVAGVLQGPVEVDDAVEGAAGADPLVDVFADVLVVSRVVVVGAFEGEDRAPEDLYAGGAGLADHGPQAVLEF